MAELPIRSHVLRATPGVAGRDGYRWHVALEDEDGAEALLVVDLGASAGVETRLSRSDLNKQLPDALRRFAAGKLRNDLPVLDQVADWDSPIVLAAGYFRAPAT